MLLTSTDDSTRSEAKQQGSSSTPAVQSSTPVSEPTADESDAAAKPAQNSVLRSGEGVQMVSDTSLDLDSDAPNWDARTFTHKDTDLYLNSNGFIGGLEAPRLIVTTGEKRSPQTCAAQTALETVIEHDDLRPGVTACVLTTEQRWAWVEVQKYSPDPLKLSVDVIVWSAVASAPEET
ncbi:hypothetical protein ACIBSR_12685 [Streptomyces sp. NPDC049936]|uniref:hypothetical protein n=1 Tax=Streptomyces sp. NPDC049936 TaxID=3365599 RepID=UPI0037BC6A93